MTTIAYLIMVTEDQLLITLLQLKFKQILAWNKVKLVNLRIFYI